MIRHKFLIGDVLKKVTTKKLPLKAKALPKITNGDKSLVPLMAAGVENQGCVGYVNPNEPTVLHNLITVSANGANSGATFYQQRKFSILQDAYALELVDKYADYASDNVYLYLTAVIDHRLKDNGYNNKATWNRIKNYYIELPVTPAGEPDFEYMTMRIRELEAQRIRELEAQRIRELEAYLRVTGLDDTTLSASEAQALTQKVQWKKFKIGASYVIRGHEVLNDENGIFVIKPTKRRINSKDAKVKGPFNYVSRGTTNNGIVSKIQYDPQYLNEDHTLSFAQDTAAIFYQDEPYFTGNKVNVFKLNEKYGKLTDELGLYLCCAIQLAFPDFKWGTLLNIEKIANTDIMLPVTSTGEIDFGYMQNYIRATEKRTIKGVVEYKDRVIAETKKVVGE